MTIKLDVYFGVEFIAIINSADRVECLYWHIDEWERDSTVVFSICNAIKQAYEIPEVLFNEPSVQKHYEDAKKNEIIYDNFQ